MPQTLGERYLPRNYISVFDEPQCNMWLDVFHLGCSVCMCAICVCVVCVCWTADEGQQPQPALPRPDGHVDALSRGTSDSLPTSEVHVYARPLAATYRLCGHLWHAIGQNMEVGGLLGNL